MDELPIELLARMLDFALNSGGHKGAHPLARVCRRWRAALRLHGPRERIARWRMRRVARTYAAAVVKAMCQLTFCNVLLDDGRSARVISISLFDKMVGPRVRWSVQPRERFACRSGFSLLSTRAARHKVENWMLAHPDTAPVLRFPYWDRAQAMRYTGLLPEISINIRTWPTVSVSLHGEAIKNGEAVLVPLRAKIDAPLPACCPGHLFGCL